MNCNSLIVGVEARNYWTNGLKPERLDENPRIEIARSSMGHNQDTLELMSI
jgi:hypothetical protein